jgi:hypothetical protein
MAIVSYCAPEYSSLEALRHLAFFLNAVWASVNSVNVLLGSWVTSEVTSKLRE